MAEVLEDDKSKTTEVKKLVKNATDLQRLKLERLMKNPVCKLYLVLFCYMPLKFHKFAFPFS